ncbi:hypothetical protein WN55_06559 [Dufourea novaeangliae]|uniref:Uncharacterized protein n=1 Tax=Dufourea novaeangliae TaxID=178035 RepID=A0A154PQP7_DUFNO|nr:hypothetical protein WN55_06559 [Dufourea novaeangliae]
MEGSSADIPPLNPEETSQPPNSIAIIYDVDVPRERYRPILISGKRLRPRDTKNHSRSRRGRYSNSPGVMRDYRKRRQSRETRVWLHVFSVRDHSLVNSEIERSGHGETTGKRAIHSDERDEKQEGSTRNDREQAGAGSFRKRRGKGKKNNSNPAALLSSKTSRHDYESRRKPNESTVKRAALTSPTILSISAAGPPRGAEETTIRCPWGPPKKGEDEEVGSVEVRSTDQSKIPQLMSPWGEGSPFRRQGKISPAQKGGSQRAMIIVVYGTGAAGERYTFCGFLGR